MVCIPFVTLEPKDRLFISPRSNFFFLLPSMNRYLEYVTLYIDAAIQVLQVTCANHINIVDTDLYTDLCQQC